MAAKSAAERRHRRRHIQALQAALLKALLAVFRALPVAWASALGSIALRTVGPFLAGPRRRALRNLDIAFPELDDAAKRRILAGMWDNLGRLAGEYPHLSRLWDDPDRVERIGFEHFEAAKATGRPILLIAGHIGNWELAAHASGRVAHPAAIIYRAPNNRYLDPVIRGLRHAPGLIQLRKGPEAAKGTVRLLSERGTLAILVDQRMGSGVPLPFFGQMAMTATLPAQLALRYDGIILPVRVRRTRGARFQVIAHPPIELTRSGDREADVQAILTRINAVLEEWVRDEPSQWLWTHRRWRA